MRVTPNCDPLNNFYISAETGIQFNPDIAFGGGNYMVVWVDGRAGGSKYRIFGSRVTPSGTVLDPSGIQISQADTLYHYSTSIAYNGTNFFAVWCNIYAPQRVLGRFINTNGSLSDTCRIASATNYLYKVRVAFSGSNYLVAWNEYSGTYVCKGQMVSLSGTPIGSPFTIASGVYYPSLGLCWDGSQYCVSYILQSGYQLWGQKYDLIGTPIGTAFQISPSVNNHYYGEIVPGANNRYLNVWSETVGTYYDIFGNLDINIIGIEEQTEKTATMDELGTKIVSGPLHLPNGVNARIFDITGREVSISNLAPGIYFLETDGRISSRIIKIR